MLAPPGPARGGVQDGIDDGLIAGAAADVAGNRLDHLFARRRGHLVEQRLGGHQHAGRAVAALGGEAVHEGLLQGMEMAVADAAYRLDGPALDGLGEDQAGKLRLAVDQHRAGAAGALAAAVFRRQVADAAGNTPLRATARQTLEMTQIARETEVLVQPFGYLWHVLGLMVETLEIAAWGTVLAVLLGLPLAVIGARGYSPHPLVYGLARGIASFLRSIPDLISALWEEDFSSLQYGYVDLLMEGVSIPEVPRIDGSALDAGAKEVVLFTDPGNPTSHFELGNIYAEKGLPDKAVNEWEKQNWDQGIAVFVSSDRPVPAHEVQFNDAFWSPRLEVNRTATIPLSFQMCEETGRIEKFKVAGGLSEANFAA